LGGDEFVLLLDDIKQVNYAQEVAERIQQPSEPLYLWMVIILLCQQASASFCPLSIIEIPDDILRDADIAMYKAKTLDGHATQFLKQPCASEWVTRLELRMTSESA